MNMYTWYIIEGERKEGEIEYMGIGNVTNLLWLCVSLYNQPTNDREIEYPDIVHRHLFAGSMPCDMSDTGILKDDTPP